MNGRHFAVEGLSQKDADTIARSAVGCVMGHSRRGMRGLCRISVASGLSVALLVTGCGRPAGKQDQPVALDAIPEAAMKAAEKAAAEHFPDLKFQSATLRPNGVYEITGKSKSGKIHDVEVQADGTIVEVE